jgi:hypothetical protein
MSYRYLGNIKNIPDFKTWSVQTFGTNTMANSPSWLSKAKSEARQWSADHLSEKYGYPKVDITVTDPPDPTKWTVTDLNVMYKIGEMLGFYKCGGRVQQLEPGCMIPIHVDNLELGYITSGDQALSKNEFTEEEIKKFYDDRNSAGRVLIMLEDWKPGQMIWFWNDQTQEEYFWTKWRAGDVGYWTHWGPDGIHATVNYGYWTRGLLRLSGFKTEKLEDYIKSDTPFELDYNSYVS